MENIKINYGTSYISNLLYGSSFNIDYNSNDLIKNHIFLNNNTIEIKNTLDIGTYKIKIDYINNDVLIEKTFNITILPNFFYD